jgi:LPS O-antigen subunit length determinant protein (WzzB/FepE family)
MYARKIEQLDQASQLDDNDPKYHRYDSGPASTAARLNPRAGFLAAVVFLLGTLGGALALASQTAECAGEFPPCLSSSEITGPLSK